MSGLAHHGNSNGGPDAPTPRGGLLDFDRYLATRRFPVLDGLRAAAVLLVLVYHCPRFTLPVVELLQRSGDAGVDIFFVLSGFLITTLLLREPDAPVSTRLGRFYLKRVLRIFPLYYAAVALYWLSAHVGADPAAGAVYDAHLPYLLTYCVDMSLGQQPTPFPHFGLAWSLGVEEKFYLLWPLVAIAWRGRGVVVAGTAVIAASCLWRLWLIGHYPGELAGRLYYSFDVRTDGIMWGCVLAALLHRRASYDRIARALGSPIALAGAAALLGVAMAALANDTFSRYLAVPALATVVLAAILVRPGQALLAPLRLRAVAYVGVISYGIYILHPLAIGAAKRLTGEATDSQRLACVVLSIALSVAVAAVSFRFFESPFLALKERITRPRPRGGRLFEPAQLDERYRAG